MRGEGCCSGQISGVEYRLTLPFEPFAIGLSDADAVVKWQVLGCRTVVKL